MNYTYKKLLWGRDAHTPLNFKKGDVREVRLMDIKFCCPDADMAFQEGFIQFGTDVSFNVNSNLNIFKWEHSRDNCIAEEQFISYCPFCGTKVYSAFYLEIYKD